MGWVEQSGRAEDSGRQSTKNEECVAGSMRQASPPLAPTGSPGTASNGASQDSIIPHGGTKDDEAERW